MLKICTSEGNIHWGQVQCGWSSGKGHGWKENCSGSPRRVCLLVFIVFQMENVLLLLDLWLEVKSTKISVSYFRFEGHFRRCLLYIRSYNQLTQQVESLRRSKFSVDDPDHEQKLLKVSFTDAHDCVCVFEREKLHQFQKNDCKAN